MIKPLIALTLAAAFMLTPDAADLAATPSCAELTVRGQTGHAPHGRYTLTTYVILMPLVSNRTPQTTVELWAYTPADAYPTSEIGWALIYPNIPQAHAIFYDGEGLSPGMHAVTLQVREGGTLVDGWLTNPRCLEQMMIG